MKKKFILSLLCLGTLLPIGVRALETEDETENLDPRVVDVTVSEVDVTTFMVTMTWDELSYDWVYNPILKKYEWKLGDECVTIGTLTEEEFDEYDFTNEIYTDDTCSIYPDSYEEDTVYYQKFERIGDANIEMLDYSIGGEVVPSIIWNAEEEYSDVNAEFKYGKKMCKQITSYDIFNTLSYDEMPIYSDYDCMELSTDEEYDEDKTYYAWGVYYEDLETEELPENGRINSDYYYSSNSEEMFYYSDSELRNHYTIKVGLTGGSKTPTSGDRLGSITIRLKEVEFDING